MLNLILLLFRITTLMVIYCFRDDICIFLYQIEKVSSAQLIDYFMIALVGLLWFVMPNDFFAVISQTFNTFLVKVIKFHTVILLSLSQCLVLNYIKLYIRI